MSGVSEIVSIRSGDIGLHAPRRVEQCHGPREPVADGRQCRIWLNEAQREIDRLRRGLDGPQVSARCDTVQISDHAGDDDASCPEVTKTRLPRPVYAPPAIGDASAIEFRATPPPPPAPNVPPLHHFHITNVGSLLDVLA